MRIDLPSIRYEQASQRQSRQLSFFFMASSTPIMNSRITIRYEYPNFFLFSDDVERNWSNIEDEADASFVPLHIVDQAEQGTGYRVVASWDPTAHNNPSLTQSTKDNVRSLLLGLYGGNL